MYLTASMDSVQISLPTFWKRNGNLPQPSPGILGSFKIQSAKGNTIAVVRARSGQDGGGESVELDQLMRKQK